MIQFPDLKPASITWGLSRNTARTVGIGGQLNRISRTGDAWVCSFTMPPLQGTDATTFGPFLVAASDAAEFVVMRDPSYSFAGVAGLVPVVDGAGQTGRTVNFKNLPAGAVIPAGSRFGFPFQVLETASQFVVDGAGKVSVTFTTALRKSPAAEDAADLYAPEFVMTLDGDLAQWSVTAPLTYSYAFSMTEDTSSNAPEAPASVLILEAV
jgi:hypothetical protein